MCVHRVHAPRAHTCAQACVRSEVAFALVFWLCPHLQMFGYHLLVQGSGFSTNTGGTGNIIRIGKKYFCDPIPLHCTVNQIACKTRPALEGRCLVFVCLNPKPKTQILNPKLEVRCLVFVDYQILRSQNLQPCGQRAWPLEGRLSK